VEFDPRVNGAEIRLQMRRAAKAGAKLIQFTEGAISGYKSGANKQSPARWNVDWPVLRNELETTAALAAELRLWTVVGSNHPLTPPNRPHNVQRFSLGGAAHRSLRCIRGWIRAGERKTCWAKPRPRTVGLWALNAAGSFADAPSEHYERRVEGTGPGTRVFERSS
jgi:hypothetical protein